jgi:hypothetical protein
MTFCRRQEQTDELQELKKTDNMEKTELLEKYKIVFNKEYPFYMPPIEDRFIRLIIDIGLTGISEDKAIQIASLHAFKPRSLDGDLLQLISDFQNYGK